MSLINLDRVNRFAAIDPGVGGTGLALFDDGVPVEVAVIKPERGTRKGSFEERAEDVVFLARRWIEERDPTIVIIEAPEIMEGSRKGTAAKNSGAVIKLATLVGMLIGAVRFSLQETPVVITVTPKAWKGQLPKEVSTARIFNKIDDPDILAALMKDKGSHATDAVGIGLFAIGEF